MARRRTAAGAARPGPRRLARGGVVSGAWHTHGHGEDRGRAALP
ncbi:hypothetical protein SLNWT_1592 [Streptomyces albus]|uniref:Uncharacterized protein n=1 Tax=Streptomyces albus (strain ATCC 21838 / DSM 41398 / FERM P-419 / JCM 4703 / NBRC 107858) TaxID=1081613 RepID=A0A0B5EIC0_STRA4|nr:hypothetical protein SLNWT_1592 [Streptomyces albus]AOU76285.1 hypothetical protein SLNHY_1594 [Streptomyces albus]